MNSLLQAITNFFKQPDRKIPHPVTADDVKITIPVPDGLGVEQKLGRMRTLPMIHAGSIDRMSEEQNHFDSESMHVSLSSTPKNPMDKVMMFQQKDRRKRHCDTYSNPPMVASPYCSTGYLTANRGPSIYLLKPGMGKHRGSVAHDELLMKFDFDPTDLVDYPSSVITRIMSPDEKKSMDELYKRVRERAKDMKLTIITPQAPLSYSSPEVKENIQKLIAMGIEKEVIDFFLLRAAARLINFGEDRPLFFDGLIKDIENMGGNWISQMPIPHPNTKMFAAKIKVYLKVALYQHLLKELNELDSYRTVLAFNDQIDYFVDEYYIRTRSVATTAIASPYILYSELQPLVEELLLQGKLVMPTLPWHYESVTRLSLS